MRDGSYPRYHPAFRQKTDSLQRTNIRVSCNVEMTQALTTLQRRSSGMIFLCPPSPVLTTHRLSGTCRNRLLFPVIRCKIIKLRLDRLYEKKKYLSNSFMLK